MMTDLSELTLDQRLRVHCVELVIENNKDAGYTLSPKGILRQAQILEDHIMQNDKRDGDSSDEYETAKNVNESSDTVQQGPEDFFRSELKQLLNKHSIDNDLNTPDWILAEALTRHLDSLFVYNRELSRWELETGRARIEPETKFIPRPGYMGPFGGGI